jgi:hypothetical protein
MELSKRALDQIIGIVDSQQQIPGNQKNEKILPFLAWKCEVNFIRERADFMS